MMGLEEVKLPNKYSRFFYDYFYNPIMSLTEDHKKFLKDNNEASPSLTLLVIMTLSDIFPKKVSTYNVTNKDEILAYRMIGHDLSNSLQVAAQISKVLETKNITEEDYISSISPKNDPDYYESSLDDKVMSLKLLSNAQMYLITKDSRYLNYTNSINLESDFKNLKKYLKGNISFDNSSRDNLNSFDYVLLYQFVKNARDNYSITITEDDENKIISFSDEGEGILDKSKNPITIDELPNIFMGYSTTGGGLGLQIVRRLTELIGGNLNVTSKRVSDPEGMAIHYDLQTDKTKLIESSMKKGTNFQVIYSKNFLNNNQ